MKKLDGTELNGKRIKLVDVSEVILFTINFVTCTFNLNKCALNELLVTLRKESKFRDATTGFVAKWRLRNERWNSLLMTHNYPDLFRATDLLIGPAAWEICFSQSETLPRSG